MDDFLALGYLAALVGMLALLALLIVRQVLRNRDLENIISRLQPKLQQGQGTPEEFYELGGVYLRKKLYSAAAGEFQKALKQGGTFPELYNALGYAYFCQQQLDLAIANYKKALEQQGGYVDRLEQPRQRLRTKKLVPQAIAAYEQALQADAANETARRRLTALQKRFAPPASETPAKS
ncbi:MAG: tetratricopeptide repeat protein [Oscillatoriales cyanobacterium SM2_1_8]|nr:tetratricopeptide repeat protein [Oscillatoriales cyanobacterium SM2_1_8]